MTINVAQCSIAIDIRLYHNALFPLEQEFLLSSELDQI